MGQGKANPARTTRVPRVSVAPPAEPSPFPDSWVMTLEHVPPGGKGGFRAIMDARSMAEYPGGAEAFVADMAVNTYRACFVTEQRA